jgi:hypothetical protein
MLMRLRFPVNSKFTYIESGVPDLARPFAEFPSFRKDNRDARRFSMTTNVMFNDWLWKMLFGPDRVRILALEEIALLNN